MDCLMYLGTVMDLYRRRIVGWSRGENNDAALICEALRQAQQTRGRLRAGLIHHSDRELRRIVALVEVKGEKVALEFITNNVAWAAGSVCDRYQISGCSMSQTSRTVRDRFAAAALRKRGPFDRS